MKYYDGRNYTSVAHSLVCFEAQESSFQFVLDKDLRQHLPEGVKAMMGQIKAENLYDYLNRWGGTDTCSYTTGDLSSNRYLVEFSAQMEELTAIFEDGTTSKVYLYNIPRVSDANILVVVGMDDSKTSSTYAYGDTKELTGVSMYMNAERHPSENNFYRGCYAFSQGQWLALGNIQPAIDKNYIFEGATSDQWEHDRMAAEVEADWSFSYQSYDIDASLTNGEVFVPLFRYNYNARSLSLLEAFCPVGEAVGNPCYILEFFKSDGSPYGVGEGFDINDFDVSKTKLVGYSNGSWSYSGHDVVWIDSVAYRNYRVGFDTHNCDLQPGHLYGIVYKKGSTAGKLAMSKIYNDAEGNAGVNGKISSALYNSLSSALYNQTIGASSSSFSFIIGGGGGHCSHIVYRRVNDPAGSYGTTIYPSSILY
ncbi:MAG: hypothetical protein HUK12_00040 [Muribaculaceae bacterium]|nr:hypothetical protein [Muribaculaceae bacterium]MCF0221511.1 hypothetical protein [Fibrobacter sp.]